MKISSTYLIGAVAAAVALGGRRARRSLLRTPLSSSGSNSSHKMVQARVPSTKSCHGAWCRTAGRRRSPDDFGALVHDYDGQRVRLPGYVLPLDFDYTSIKVFLLVPYVGACIHVPPPPPNQIVYVTSEEGFVVRGMFEPVWVTGTFNTASISNELANIGYRIEAGFGRTLRGMNVGPGGCG